MTIDLIRQESTCGHPTAVLRRIDDLDMSYPAESVQFGLDGEDYEIDLNSVNAATLRGLLRPYISVARNATTGARW